MKNINLKSERGFTLIEILIVVAIIAVLASAVLIGLGPVQRQGRDARRIQDLRQVQNALELYYSKCGYYPGGVNSAAPPCAAWSAVSTWNNVTDALEGSSIGVPQIPNDPTSGSDYFYGTSGTGNSYVVGARLEDANNSALQNSAAGTIFGVDCTAPVFCIQF